jgi:hypothetical protein
MASAAPTRDIHVKLEIDVLHTCYSWCVYVMRLVCHMGRRRCTTTQ